MRRIYKVISLVLALTGSLPCLGQHKVIYPEPLLSENSEIWGYAYNYDRTKQVIDYKFQSADHFESATGLALVRFDGYAGAINLDGEFVIEPIYDDVIYQPISNTYLVLKDEKYGEVDKLGNLIKLIKYDSLTPQSKKGWYEFREGEDYFYIAPDGHVTSDWSEYLNAPYEDW